MSTSQCAVISGKRYPRVPGCAFPFLRETEKRRKNSPDRKLSAGVHWKNPAGGNSGLILNSVYRSNDRRTSKVIPSVAAM